MRNPRQSSDPAETGARVFAAKGVVRELSPDDQTVTISHEAISNYMAAMTMPFKVKDTRRTGRLAARREVTFGST